MNQSKLFTLVAATSLSLSIGCSSKKPEAPAKEPAAEAKPAAPATAVKAETLALFQPALEAKGGAGLTDAQKAVTDLGRHLYYEERLSGNDKISCNTCHLLDNFGVDGVDFSKGVPGEKVPRNSPTVYNAFMHVAQFWDGRAADVEEQAKGPILAGKEMGMPSAEAVVKKLKGIKEYRPLFAKAFPADKDPLTYDNVGKAIGAFERELTTPSKFDAFLNGDAAALSDAEKDGLNKFAEVGCTTCHMGTLLGGSIYQKAGLVKPWPNQKDQGRFGVTQKEEDKMMFKVPSLRNIAKTGPYFHDSSATSLEQAIQIMGSHQLGKDLKPDEVKSIATFLNALTGEVPTAYIKRQPL